MKAMIRILPIAVRSETCMTGLLCYIHVHSLVLQKPGPERKAQMIISLKDIS